MKNKRILGIVLTVLGLALIINSQTTFIGVNLSPPESSIDFGLILGLVFVVVGLYLGFATRRVGEIKKSRRFLKDIKKLKPGELEKVESAIDKIGTGQGKEEKLKHLPGYAIRVDKKSRVRYDYEPNGDVTITEYDREHSYR